MGNLPRELERGRVRIDIETLRPISRLQFPSFLPFVRSPRNIVSRLRTVIELSDLSWKEEEVYFLILPREKKIRKEKTQL